jgi:hypothetical protein
MGKSMEDPKSAGSSSISRVQLIFLIHAPEKTRKMVGHLGIPVMSRREVMMIFILIISHEIFP